MESSASDTQQQMQQTSSQAHEDHKRTEGKRLKEGTGHSIQVDDHQKIGGDIKMAKKPAFIEERKKIFDELIDEQNKKYLGKQ